MANNNQALIDGLRQAAEFLEARPDFPQMGPQRLGLFTDKAVLRTAARQLGSFTKKFTDYWFEIQRPINEELAIEVYISREEVCKKVITWECPDEESLLRLVAEEPSEAETCEQIGREQ